MLTHLFHQGAIVGVGREHVGDADDEELLACAGDGDIELAVDGVGARGEECLACALYDELHLSGFGDGSAIDDDVALASLIALYGIDADTFGIVGHVEGAQMMTYEGSLSAEGGNDTYRARCVVGELIGLVETDDGLHDIGTEACLTTIGLEALGSVGCLTFYEGRAASGYEALHGAIGVIRGVCQRLLLMR